MIPFAHLKKFRKHFVYLHKINSKTIKNEKDKEKGTKKSRSFGEGYQKEHV